jgi:hypothetical protein
LSEVPRPAKALPKPSRLVRALVRVWVSKVLLMSSNSVWPWKQPFFDSSGIWLANVAGSVGRRQVAPSSVPSKVKPSGAASPSPRTISRYLRPNEDR